MTDFLVIGAGPAGMAAAIEASRQGASVTVVDNRPEPGGNIYAGMQSTRIERPHIYNALGSSYHDGAGLVDAFISAKTNYLPSHMLWHLDPDGIASVRGPSGVLTFHSEKVILATGAQERPVPVTGWTLPGVMGVGAAQILLKASGDIPKSPVIIIGHGPLPLLYAAQVLSVGGQISAFVEPELPRSFSALGKNLSGAWYGRDYLLKGTYYLWKRLLSRVPVYRRAKDIRIAGTVQVSEVRFRTTQEHILQAQSVLLHDGVVPNVNPAAAGGLPLERNEIQDCWAPLSNDIIQLAGDAAGILGAKSAELTGKAAVYRLMGEAEPREITRALNNERKFRSFIDGVYPPLGNGALASDETIICRCEAVTKASILAAIRSSGTDPNRLKTNLRCGMGPCQGRMCGLSVERIISEATGTPKRDVGLHRLRNPIVPITIGNLATAQPASGNTIPLSGEIERSASNSGERS